MRRKTFLWGIALLAVFLLSACKEEYEIPDHIREQLSLEIEKEQREEIVDLFYSEGKDPVVYDNPQEIAKDYVPEGAEVWEVCSYSGGVTISYRVGNYGIFATYGKAGYVYKSVREGHSDLTFSVSSDSEEIEIYDSEANRQTYTNWWLRIFG